MKTPHYSVTAMLFVSATLLLNACSGTSDSSGSDFSSRWDGAELIENAPEDAENPQIAIDDSGDAMAVWAQEGSAYNIWANRYTTGGGWDPDEANSIQVNDNESVNPQIAMNADGNAIAVWVQKGFSYEIWVNRYDAGTALWGGAGRIGAADADANPQIAIDANGNAFVVWSLGDDVWSKRYDAANGWDILTKKHSSGVASEPQIAMNSQGDAVVVWGQRVMSQLKIWADRYTPGSGWDGGRRIDTDDDKDAKKPQIAIDDDGNAFAVWVQDDAIQARPYTTSNSSWGTVERISASEFACDGDCGDPGDPQIVIDADGNAMAVWVQNNPNDSNDDNTDIMYNYFTPAADEWSNPTQVESINGTDSKKPQLAIDADGNTLVVWMQRHENDSDHDIGANYFTTPCAIDEGENCWDEEETIDSDDADAVDPQIAMNADGIALAVWSQGGDIWSNRFE